MQVGSAWHRLREIRTQKALIARWGRGVGGMRPGCSGRKRGTSFRGFVLRALAGGGGAWSGSAVRLPTNLSSYAEYRPVGGGPPGPSMPARVAREPPLASRPFPLFGSKACWDGGAMPLVEGIDRETGQKVTLSVYFRDGKIIYQRFSDALTGVEKATAPQLEARADFAEKAYTAYGQPMTGDLPPAAEAVESLRRNLPSEHSRAEREEVQERYRSMVAPEARAEAEAMARLTASARRHGLEHPSRPSPVAPARREPPRTMVSSEHPLKSLVEGAQTDSALRTQEHPLKALLERHRRSLKLLERH